MLQRWLQLVPSGLRDAVRARVQPPMLREGETAPEWTLEGSDGRVHQSGPYWTLLAFYPGDGTAACTAQLAELEAQRATLEGLGVTIYGINPSDGASHRAFAEKAGLGFPLLVDEDAAVARAWGAYADVPVLGPRVFRTVYLINPLRKIRLANRGAPSVAAIVRSVQALQHATRSKM